MRIKGVDLKFKRGQDTSSFMLTSCNHIGCPDPCEEGMENKAKACKTMPWVDLGDMIEGIMPGGDRRYSAKERKESLVLEMEGAIDYIKPIKKTCWGLIEGNHEDSASRTVGDVTGFMARQAKVPHLGQTAYLRVICPDGELIVFLAHGHWSMNYRAGEPERIPTNRKIRLRDLLKRFHAGLCAIGHFHRTIVTPPVYIMKLGLKDGEVKNRPVLSIPTWYAAAPSMFKTYGTEPNYAQKALFPPTANGWLEVDVERNGNIPKIRQMLHTGKVGHVYEPEVVD